MGQVIPLHRAAPESAVERLNRLTGLDFSEYPQSLLSDSSACEEEPSALPIQKQR